MKYTGFDLPLTTTLIYVHKCAHEQLQVQANNFICEESWKPSSGFQISAMFLEENIAAT